MSPMALVSAAMRASRSALVSLATASVGFGDAAVAAVKDKSWDVSVKSLVAFPQTLAMMNNNLEWTQKVGDAMNILAFSTKGMAIDARKVLASAIANAENNHNLDVDALVVAEASVGKSITMKRFHTRGRGKSTRILKPFSRLRIVVREVEEA